MNYLRGLSVTVLSTGLTFLLGFTNQSLLAANLERGDYGDLRIWFTTVMMGGLALGEWLNRGNSFIVGRERHRDGVVVNGVAYGILLSLLLFPLIGLFAGPIGRFLPITGNQWVLFPLLILLAVALKGGQGVLLGEDRIGYHAFLPLIFITCYLGANGALILLSELHLSRVLLSWVFASILVAFVAVSPLVLRLQSCRPDRSLFLRTLSVGGRGSISVILVFLLFRSDVYLIDYFLGSGKVGAYAVAGVFAEMMQRLPNMAGLVLLPKVIKGEDLDARLSTRVAQATLLFGLIAAIIMLVAGKPILALFFPAFPDAVDPLLWMLPGLVLSGFGSVLNVKLAGQGYPAIIVWAPAAALILNVGANLVLIPAMGLRGAAISTSVAYGIWAVIITASYLHRTRLGWSSLLDLRGLFADRKLK